VDLLDRDRVPVDQIQVHPGQETMVLGEPAGQCLGQRRDLRAQPALGQIGQRSGVVLPVDQRFEHQSSRDAHDVGGDRGQFDTGVLEQLLQPLDLAAALAGDRGPGPGQVAELPDRFGRDE